LVVFLEESWVVNLKLKIFGKNVAKFEEFLITLVYINCAETLRLALRCDDKQISYIV